jgi:hypothetical protein
MAWLKEQSDRKVLNPQYIDSSKWAVRAWYMREGTSYVQLEYKGAETERAQEVRDMKEKAQEQRWAS